MTVPRTKFARVLHPLGRLAGRSAGAGLVLAVVLTLLPVRVQAQQPDAPTLGMIISVGGNERRKHASGKKIARIQIADPTKVSVVPIAPGDEVVITGSAPGISRVNLIDVDNKQESFEVVVVAFDIRQLEQVLRKVVPTATIRPVPSGNNGVVLTGTVDRAEDLPIAVQAAQDVVGGVRITNALRVGGVQQVQLDVVLARVNRREFRSMAFNFFANSQNTYIGSTVGQAVINPISVGSGSLLSPTLNGQLLQGVPGTPNGVPTNILYGVLHNGWGFLHFLEALRQENLAKLMSEPRLVTMSGRQASFLDGGEQAIPVPAGLGQVGVQFEEFGTRLNFIPIVLGNGRIHLEVEPEVSFLDPNAGTSINGTIVPGRVTQRVRTTVEMETGQTFVIGGLIQHTVLATTQKVPILGDLPVFGALFSSKSFDEQESELLIIVTPHLVDPIDCSQYPTCLPGQETRSPDDYELFLEGILEAPRGPREVCHGKTYKAAYTNDPTTSLFPCAGGDYHGNGHHGGHMGGNGFVQGGLCPTCPGGSAVNVQPHTSHKMPASAPVMNQPTSMAPRQMDRISTMPIKPSTGSKPATLPSALESPSLSPQQ